MKFSAVILAIFCLLIATYPCCIFDNCENDSIATTAKSEQEQQEESGVCSPFIACGSCNGFVPGPQVFHALYLLPVKKTPKLSFGTYFNSVETDYTDRQWQPPKQVIIS